MFNVAWIKRSIEGFHLINGIRSYQSYKTQREQTEIRERPRQLVVVPEASCSESRFASATNANSCTNAEFVPPSLLLPLPPLGLCVCVCVCVWFCRCRWLTRRIADSSTTPGCERMNVLLLMPLLPLPGLSSRLSSLLFDCSHMHYCRANITIAIINVVINSSIM